MVLDKNSILYRRYLIKKVLGRGGFCICYLATDIETNMEVTIKEFGEEEQLIELFDNEVSIIKKVSHLPHVTSYLNSFQQNNKSYIVMEYVDGITLQDMIKREGKLGEEAALMLLKPIVNSLEAIHKKGILHRDICPEHIMISNDMDAKIIDYGSAIDLQCQNTRYIMEPTYRKYFSPPEQVKKNGIMGSWSDVYSMCATICYSLKDLEQTEFVKRIKKEGMALDYKERWNNVEVLMQMLDRY